MGQLGFCSVRVPFSHSSFCGLKGKYDVVVAQTFLYTSKNETGFDRFPRKDTHCTDHDNHSHDLGFRVVAINPHFIASDDHETKVSVVSNLLSSASLASGAGPSSGARMRQRCASS